MMKRVPDDHAYDPASLRLAPGPGLTLVVFDPDATPPTPAPEKIVGLGDQASIYAGRLGHESDAPTGYSVSVTNGSRSFLLMYIPAVMDKESHDTAVQLAREVVAGGFLWGLDAFPLAERRIAVDKNAVAQSPDNLELWNEIAVLSFRLKKLDDARDAYFRVSQFLPTDPGGYLGVALCDWMKTYRVRSQLAIERGARPTDNVALDPRFREFCEDLRRTNRAAIDEGYANARKALELLPGGNFNPIVGLLAAERKNTECGDALAVKADEEEAAQHSGWLKPLARLQGSRVELPSQLVEAPPPPPLQSALGGIISSMPRAGSRAGDAARVRVAGGISQGLLIRRVQPAYPSLARQARIQGRVLLHAIINKEGDIDELQLISGHPMLVPPAIEAVKQWKYKPYLLNGEPIEIDTQIEVNFTLSGQ